MKNRVYPQRVGEDTIVRKGDRLVLYSKVDMEDWVVLHTRKTAIYINDEAWCLVGKQSSAGEVCYILEPWPDVTSEVSGRVVRYSERYVRFRDEAVKQRRRENGIGAVLYYLRFLIGFLPSGVKAKIETAFGVPAKNATIISIFIELMSFFVLGIWLLYVFGMFYWSQSDRFVYDYAVVEALIEYTPAFIVLPLILLIDVVMRYDSYLRSDHSPLGVFEWVWRMFKKAPRKPAGSSFKTRRQSYDNLRRPRNQGLRPGQKRSLP